MCAHSKTMQTKATNWFKMPDAIDSWLESEREGEGRVGGGSIIWGCLGPSHIFDFISKLTSEKRSCAPRSKLECHALRLCSTLITYARPLANTCRPVLPCFTRAMWQPDRVWPGALPKCRFLDVEFQCAASTSSAFSIVLCLNEVLVCLVCKLRWIQFCAPLPNFQVCN